MLKIKKKIVRLRMWYADVRGHHGKRWNYEPGDWYMGRHKLKHDKKLDKYTYAHGVRYMDHGSRNYEVAGYRLPSVTTILGRTKDDTFLKDWIKKKGKKRSRAYQECQSAVRGTSMHKYLENYVLGKGYEDLTELGQETKRMAEKVIEVGLAPVSEYFGSEVTLYYPGLYAGSTDLVGIHNDKETIIDFKQANRPKREEWIGDYKLAGWCICHGT